MRFFFQLLVLLGSTAVYLCAKIPPDVVPIIALACLLIPFVLIFNLIGLIFSISGGIKSFWGYAISLLLGSNFLLGTFGLSVRGDFEQAQFRVLSYNLHGFRPVNARGNKDVQQKMVDYVLNHPANIKGLQEFYTHTRNRDNMDVIAKFKKAGYHAYFEPLTINDLHHDMGLAIFSKFPIINQGKIIDNRPSLNNVIFADIVVGADTIRIYNAHFQSMGIDPNHVVETEQLKEEYRQVGRKFRGGAEVRTKQMRDVLAHIEKCPYPIIFMGDFNDTPYSYIYRQFKNRFSNAFEKKGFGFGFTMNSRLFFLRIDNIFVSEHFKVKAFSSHRNIPYSDHFPIEAALEFR